MKSHDTGPLHIAAAVGTPFVGLYGVTNPNVSGPFGTSNRVVTPEGMEWRDPLRHPYGKVRAENMDIMRAIHTSMVVSACEEILSTVASEPNLGST